jgi:integrase
VQPYSLSAGTKWNQKRGFAMQSRITNATLKRKYREGGDNEIWDTVVPGFGLRVGKRRKTYFVMPRINGERIRHKIGTSDSLGLSEARDAARDVLRNIEKGIHPKSAGRTATQEAERARARTFQAVSDEFMAKRKRLRSYAELRRKLDVDIHPVIGDLQIDQIDKADVRKLIRDKAAVSPVAANRVLSLLRSILRFAMKEDYVETNVADAIDPEPESSRDRVLAHSEIKAFWGTLDSNNIDLDPSTRVCLKFLLATGQRRGEAAMALWDEFDFAKDQWLIPGKRTKNAQPHIVPLSPLALSLLDEMAEWSDGHHVFPGQFGDGHLSPYSISQGMKKALPKMNLPGGRATPHDLRRTMVTELNETLTIEPHVVEALVNHVSGAARAGVAGVYNRALYIEQRRLAMQAWGDLLTEIVTGKKSGGNVVDLRRVAK